MEGLTWAVPVVVVGLFDIAVIWKGSRAHGLAITKVRCYIPLEAGGHRYNADNNINRIHSFFGFKDGKGRNYRLSYLISSSDIGHPGFDVDSTSNNYRRSNRLSQYLQLRTFYALSTGLSMSHSIFYNSFQTDYVYVHLQNHFQHPHELHFHSNHIHLQLNHLQQFYL